MVTIPCPSCGAPGLTQESTDQLRCRYCGSTFQGKPYLCPNCGWINATEAENCLNCGEPLSIVSEVIYRQRKETTPSWIQRVRSQAEAIKTSEELASQHRFRQLEDIDRTRMEAESREKQRQAQRDRQLFAFVLIFALVIIMIIILAVILTR
jgi:predicted amidophosphoribosyltransferase